MSTIYLYVKTHNKTGLKYLGKTTVSDPHKYTGSGLYWKNHLNKHGYDYSTEIIAKFNDKDEIKRLGLYYSNLWNVVLSTEWANLKEEAGDGGNLSDLTRAKLSLASKGCNNGFYGRTHTDRTKQQIRDAKIGSPGPFLGKSHSTETKKKISISKLGKPSPNKGKKLSEEQKKKISATKRNKNAPPL